MDRTASIFNFSLTICFPKLIKVSKKFKEKIKVTSKNIKISNNPQVACKDSDCIITDTWFSMGKKFTQNLLKAFKPYKLIIKL